MFFTKSCFQFETKKIIFTLEKGYTLRWIDGFNNDRNFSSSKKYSDCKFLRAKMKFSF